MEHTVILLSIIMISRTFRFFKLLTGHTRSLTICLYYFELSGIFGVTNATTFISTQQAIQLPPPPPEGGHFVTETHAHVLIQ